jgi:glucose-6-phosphate isomerase
MIGDVGLSASDVDGLKPQLSQIHRGLNDLKKLGQLPFLDLPFQEEPVRRVLKSAGEMRSRFEKAVVLGMGGSALGPKLLVNVLGTGKGLEITVCDSLDPQAWSSLAASVDPRKTLLVVISKSGKTLETWAALIYFVERFRSLLGDSVWSHVAVVTDPRLGPLRRLAEEKSLPCFEIAAGVGGRYSILSPVGLLPAALAGADIEALMGGARRMEERCRTDDPMMNPALMSAVLHHRFETGRGRNVRVLLSYGEGVRDYGPWFAQLWAESLGKRASLDGTSQAVGSTPVCAIGPEDQHSQLQLYLEGPEDKVVTFLGVEETAEDIKLPPVPDWVQGLEADGALLERRGVHELCTASRLATEEALRANGRPNQTILLKRLDAFSIGQLLMMAELETVYAGELLGVNPFDQPAVEQIKQNVREFLNGRITPSKSRNYMI